MDSLNLVGAACFGILIGWFVYYINRYRSGTLQLSDLTTLISVIGGGAATAYAGKGSGPLFGAYSIGLLAGFFAYFLMLVILVKRSRSFDSDWFLDGRRKGPLPPFSIPDGTTVTARPSVAGISQGILPPLAVLPRSVRSAPRDLRVADVDPQNTIKLTIVLKRGAEIASELLGPNKHLTIEQYRAQYATTATAINLVTDYAQAQGLTVESVDPARHTVKLSGSYALACEAFRPESIGIYTDGVGRYVARTGRLSAPASLAPFLVSIMGFDQRPVAEPHVRIVSNAVMMSSYDPSALAARYHFPQGVTGSGQTIALIELGGGYDPDAMDSYFSKKSVPRTGALKCVPANYPSSVATTAPSTADAEVQLDIQVAGSVAPGANLTVYFGDGNTNSGFLDAVDNAIHETIDPPSIISISWGAAETRWTAQDMDALDQAFQTAASLNITVFAASGDAGAVDDSPDGQFTADFPASSPNVIGCGGTSIQTDGSEVAWNEGADAASGGGYSKHFSKPSYQAAAVSGAFRGVPDVAGNADQSSGYNVVVDGNPLSVGGTSAVAPLWAGLIALINEKRGQRAGPLNPILYTTTCSAAFIDIVAGTNNGYAAAPGWDPVTGLGVPVGTQLLSLL